jgi:hypothetical protein
MKETRTGKVSAPAGFRRPPQTIRLANHLCCLHTFTDNNGLDLHQDCGGHGNPAGTQKEVRKLLKLFSAVPQFADLETTAVSATCSDKCMPGSNKCSAFFPQEGEENSFLAM